MSEAAGMAPTVKRQPLDGSAIGVGIALGGAALAVVAAIWLPFRDPASLRRAYGPDEEGFAAQVLERNSLMHELPPVGWLFIGVALACAVSLVISYRRRREARGPIVAGVVAMCVAVLAVVTAPLMTPSTFGFSSGAATAGLGLYAELVAGLLMVIGGLGIRSSASTRALVVLAAVGVVIATSAWWYGSMYGGEPAPRTIIVNAPPGGP